MTKVTVGRLPAVSGLFTSESVADGHPDKICDQVSDAVLDAVLRRDPAARVAVETAIKDNAVWVFGELTGGRSLDVGAIVRSVLADIGHVDGRWGLDLDRLDVRVLLGHQAAEIAHGVDSHADLGAGDQGMMFGFASDETDELMPTPISWAHRMMRQHKALRAANPLLGPDAKAQVSVRYEAGRPVGIHAIVLSSQHSGDLSIADVRDLLREEIIRPVFGAAADGAIMYLNPAGPFTQGGPIADAGLTERKIVVDTYGGFARHGGGAFSGKDGTKVDRSAAYAARQLAVSLVMGKFARGAETRLAYAIGEAEPVSIHIDVAGDGPLPLICNETAMLELFRPRAIIERLALTEPCFHPTASFGHFGRPEFAWEQPIGLEGLIDMGRAST